MKYLVICLVSLWLPLSAIAQISGNVRGYDGDTLVNLPGANVYWEGTETGTVTDKNGYYEIPKVPGSQSLVVSFIGYQSQSKVVISRSGKINFTLAPEGSELTEVEILARIDATAVDLKAAELTYNIDDKELRKAACCNLSESFETNASVDVSFTDAITGQRQIEMLGQAGKYALIQRENIPFARGMNAQSGLTYIPGPFVESIQLTKGLSSVLNGYESLTGQINVEFLKPETAPHLFINAFANAGGRAELNAISGFEVKPGLYTATLGHYSTIAIAQDRNEDGFADIPTGNQLNFTNRWHWRSNTSGWEGQIGLSALQDERTGGQLASLNEGQQTDSLWQFQSKNRRVELFGKNGYSFKNEPFRSFGLIYSLSYQDRSARFDQRSFSGEQQSAYVNSIYQNIIGNTQHKYRTGISLLAEKVTEDLSREGQKLYNHERHEIVPGAYVEYTYEPGLRFTAVAGVRADYNAYFEQAYITPRLNLRYMPGENTTFRVGGGRGQRTPNQLTENLNLLASARQININPVLTMPEVGWNSGASINQLIPVGKRDVTINVDAFYTWFESKLMADLDFDRRQAYLIMPEGSRSFSLLSQLDFEPLKKLEVRLAYKYLRSEDAFLNGQDLSYLIPEHRAFVNFAYRTNDKWKFDATINWFGEKRLPASEGAPQEYTEPKFSPDFFTVNLQVNKVFKNRLEVFAGVDNLGDFRQLDPIVASENPGSPYFDSNYTWGPIFGRNIYLGLYYSLGVRD